MCFKTVSLERVLCQGYVYHLYANVQGLHWQCHTNVSYRIAADEVWALIAGDVQFRDPSEYGGSRPCQCRCRLGCLLLALCSMLRR